MMHNSEQLLNHWPATGLLDGATAPATPAERPKSDLPVSAWPIRAGLALGAVVLGGLGLFLAAQTGLGARPWED